MAVYLTKLIKREEIADGTMTFHFEKPAGFEFKAGQFLEMALLNPPETDAEGNGRAFSMASAPCEPDLMIATRMRASAAPERASASQRRDTAFKRVLKTLPAGAEVQIEGPFGDFTLHNNISRPAVFLMGGIGITPVRSIVVEAAEKKLVHKIFLFYSNRQSKDAAFFRELKNLELKNINYKFIPTMTDMPDNDVLWQGERGYIDSAMLKKYLPARTRASVGDFSGPIYPHTITAGEKNSDAERNSPFGVGVYYSAGPAAMVMAMRKMLNGAGVDDDDIRTEEFSGY